MGDGEQLRVSTFPSDRSLIRMHPSQIRLLSLTPRQTCTCTCGNRSVEVQVVVDPVVVPGTVLLSSALFEFVLPGISPEWVQAQFETNGIRLGPTIGVLCNPIWDDKRKRLKRSKQLQGLKKMVEAGRKADALVYLFAIQDVDFRQAQVTGYVWKDNDWRQALLPLPDAIYDQVISRKVERNPKYLEKRTRLSKLYGTRIFNDGFFDKWQVHEWLTSDKRTRRHVPDTTRYLQSRDIVGFLKHHPVIFLKPIHGSLGLGIVRLKRQGDGSVTYEVKRQEGRVSVTVGGADKVLESLRARLQGRAYLVQQGIPLAAYKNRPFDVRIVLQRDGAGQWQRTKMFTRVAQTGDFTSNLSSGGEALPVQTVLADVFANPAVRQRCRRMIRRVSLLVTEVIEEQSKKQFGELGIDMGIDEKGNVWIIEVNSKPWKSPTTEKGRQDLVDLSFSRPIEYALRLANMK